VPHTSKTAKKITADSYVAYLWKHAHLRDPFHNTQPTDHGWKGVNRVFVPLWFTGSQMPTVLSETMEPNDVTDENDDDDDDDDDSSASRGVPVTPQLRLTLLLIVTQMSNVKNIYRRRRMSRVRIGGAGGRRNVSIDCMSRMQQRTVLFSDVP